MAGASNIKFCTQLGFSKAHHKITPAKKWAWPKAMGAPHNFGVSFNISGTAEASDFRVGVPLGFLKAHHKITHRRKNGRGLGLGSSQIFGVLL